MGDKAWENLEAAERLLPDEEGEREALLDAAASRAYYAAYLAVVDRALREQRSFTGRVHFRHDQLPDDALAWRLLDADQCDNLRLLYNWRIKADYEEDLIDLEEASMAFEHARSIVEALLGSSR